MQKIYYRGSGIAEMPEGVYIADDRNNVVRITSYSQVGKLVSAVHEGASKGMQTGRVGVIHEMVRDWFVDNTLSISYQSETERYAAQAMASYTTENIKVMDEKARTVGDRTASISRVIEKRTNKIEYLNNRKNRGDKINEEGIEAEWRAAHLL